MLVQDRVRNAGEKVREPMKRATDALVLAKTAKSRSGRRKPGAVLRMLASLDDEARQARLVRRSHSRQVVLHEECFYNGLCGPLDETEPRIRERSAYIDGARRAAPTPEGGLNRPVLAILA